MKYVHLLLVCAFAAAAHTGIMAQTTADPTQLPIASRQTPNWDAYTSLGIRTAPRNTLYLDPVTLKPLRKITDSTFTGTGLNANDSMINDYSEGGPYISREWAVGQHTLLVRKYSGNTPYLVDYHRPTGISNIRQIIGDPFDQVTGAPLPRLTQSTAFASNPSNPRVMYFVDNPATDSPDAGPKLYRMNTATMALETEAHIPLEGVTFDQDIQVIADNRSTAQAYWLQTSKDDQWLMFQVCVATDNCIRKPQVLVAFNRITGDIEHRDCGASSSFTFTCDGLDGPRGLDEGHIDRDGRYVAILDRGGNDSSCTGLPGTAWHLWDLNNPNTAPVCRTGIYSGHHAWVRNLMVNSNVHATDYPNFYYDPLTNVSTVTATYQDPLIAHPERYAFVADHRAAQWIQGYTDAAQWYLGSNVNDGDATAVTGTCVPPDPCSWTKLSPTNPNDHVYYTGVDWGAAYEKEVIGIRAVYQKDPVDSNKQIHTLIPKNSVAEMRQYGLPGTFAYEWATQLLYVWAFDNGNPNDRVAIHAPTAVHRGIGIGRASGTDLRLLCHNYMNMRSSGDPYYDDPFATFSPDGKLVMFHSNMGKSGEVGDGSGMRYDVFIAEVPVSGGGGGGGCEGAAGGWAPGEGTEASGPIQQCD